MTPPPFEHPAVLVNAGKRRPHAAHVRVENGSILVDGETVCQRIDSVHLDLGERASVVVMAPERMTFGFADVADAQRMIESLGGQWSRIRTTAPIRVPLLLLDVGWLVVLTSPVWLFLAASALWLSGRTIVIVLACLAGALSGVGRSMARNRSQAIEARIDIGEDGARVEWLRLVNRFFAFSEMERASHDEEGTITLHLRGGKCVSVQAADVERVDTVTARINERIGTLRMTPMATESPVLQQPVASLTALAELRRLAAVGEGDYRIVGLDREQLWATLEDPASHALVRANAAAALSGRLDDAERGRLRVAATTTASPRVRVAIEKAASPSSTDEELLEALEQVSETVRS
jgi:hypothetical protein